MAESIIQTNEIERLYRWCYVCGQPYSEKHHIFGRCNRSLSEEDGLVVYLCRHHHNKVHECGELMDDLHELGQAAYEQKHTREQFRERYGRKYLEGEDNE